MQCTRAAVAGKACDKCPSCYTKSNHGHSPSGHFPDCCESRQFSLKFECTLHASALFGTLFVLGVTTPFGLCHAQPVARQK